MTILYNKTTLNISESHSETGFYCVLFTDPPCLASWMSASIMSGDAPITQMLKADRYSALVMFGHRTPAAPPPCGPQCVPLVHSAGGGGLGDGRTQPSPPCENQYKRVLEYLSRYGIR